MLLFFAALTARLLEPLELHLAFDRFKLLDLLFQCRSVPILLLVFFYDVVLAIVELVVLLG